MNEVQRAGDKSGEISVAPSIRTNDDSLLELASQDHNADDASFSDDNDDVSYEDDDENENDNISLYDVEEVDEDIFSRPRSRTHSRVEELHAEAQAGGGHSDDEDGMTEYGGIEYRREEVEVLVRELMDNYQELSQISTEEHKDSLMQLNSKWQEIFDQTVYEQEQHIESIVQERSENELRTEAEINGLRQVHQEELGAVKEEVMEQSQKIILQEMKVNAERERKYEEEFELRLQQAVEESKVEMSDEFDIALAGMKATQEELEQRYEELLKEKEISVRQEMSEKVNKTSESKFSLFMSQYEDMKKHVVDLTMEIQKLQIEAESKSEEKNNEIEELNVAFKKKVKTMNDESESKLREVQATHVTEIEQLQTKIEELTNNIEKKDAQNVMITEKAYSEAVENLNKEHQLEIESIRSAAANNLSKLDNLESIIERKEADFTKAIEEAHSKAVQDMKDTYVVELESLRSAAAKNVSNSEKEFDAKIKSLENRHTSEVNILKVKLVETKTSIQKHKSTIDSKDATIATLTEENKNLNDKFKLHVNQVEVDFEKERSLSKKQFEEYTYNLKEAHKSEMEMQRMQLKNEISELMAKYETIVDQKENFSSPQHPQHNTNSQELDMDEADILKQDLVEEKIGENGEETHGALANLQRKVAALQYTLHDGTMSGKNNAENDQRSQNGSKSKRKEIDTLQNEKKMHQQQSIFPAEIQLQQEKSKDPAQIEAKNNEAAITPVVEKVDSIPHSPTTISLGEASPQNVPQRDEIHFPDLSPLTLSSPPPKSTPQRRPNRIVPSSLPRLKTPRKSKVVPIDSVASQTKTRSFLKKTPLSQRLKNSASKSSLIKRNFQTPKTSKTHQTPKTSKSRMSILSSARSPPRRRVLTPRGCQESFSTFGSSFGSSIPPLEDDMRLMIINVPYTEKMKKLTKVLKLKVVDDPLLATHVIAGDSSHPMRRTWKLMAALCVTSYILKAEWLEESYKSRSLLSFNRYLLLNDTVAENAFSFSMKNTLTEGNERRRDGGLLAGWRVLLCDEVAGNKAPKEAELHTMIGAAGGKIICKDDIPLPTTDDPTHVIVITSDPALSVQLQDSKAQVAAENGAGFFTTTWLFDCMMHQKLFGIRRGLGRL